MASSPYQDEFKQYMQAHPNQKAIAVFPARGQVGASLPTVFGATPFGTIMVFPDYFVFLTLSKEDPGLGVVIHEFGPQMVRAVIDEGLGVLADLAEAASSRFDRGKHAKQFHEALENPRSMFVPLRTLRNVETGRHYSGVHYLRLTTTDRSYVYLQEAETKNPFTQLGKFVADWHPEAMTYLRQSAARSAVR